ncbi:hypothetical protein Srot_0238 [Segniliparus rotundus DSM 44985]|uniref:Uncharacterized protein n=1 Tax=Segniliparus rotundus (strain ATCC BAA-972 / CDC 1076 / CIP 108378 / DSM 44985 / JCM 13578) TaxID=640132 RepID=D6ZAI3_SEGRD|nr:hypothetical protein Srot_0238 [Segniliparus rotundus DSM 44985]
MKRGRHKPEPAPPAGLGRPAVIALIAVHYGADESAASRRGDLGETSGGEKLGDCGAWAAPSSDVTERARC